MRRIVTRCPEHGECTVAFSTGTREEVGPGLKRIPPWASDFMLAYPTLKVAAIEHNDVPATWEGLIADKHWIPPGQDRALRQLADSLEAGNREHKAAIGHFERSTRGLVEAAVEFQEAVSHQLIALRELLGERLYRQHFYQLWRPRKR